MSTTLLLHRQQLLANPERYEHDKDRAVRQFAEIAYKHYGNKGRNKKVYISLLQELGKMVFEAQEGKPLYEYKDALPRAWNSPMNGGWQVNYIKWEIGHLISVNQGGDNSPENLSFQSARCNQHIQTSMNYNETTEYNCKEEVEARVQNVFILHKSDRWLHIKAQLTR